MLRDLYVAAWVKSAEPVPQGQGEHGMAATSASAEPAGPPQIGLARPVGPILRYAPDLHPWIRTEVIRISGSGGGSRWAGAGIRRRRSSLR
jgi:hypothetical protein